MDAPLVFVSDSEPGITRQRRGRSWAYFDADGNRITDRYEIERLNGVALPPAYQNAWFCACPDGHLLATSGLAANGLDDPRGKVIALARDTVGRL